MSVRANPTLIGAFVLGATVLLVAGLLVWGGTGMFRSKHQYVMYFDSAVAGLTKGAPVLFRGVRVGEVTEVQVRWGTGLVGVYVQLEPDVLKGVPPKDLQAAIRRGINESGLRAQLRTQSLLTGVLYIGLDAFPGTPVVLHGLDKKTPELPTVPTDIEKWTAKLEKIGDAIANLPLEQLARSTVETIDEARRLLKSPEIAAALKGVDALVGDTRVLIKKVDTLTANVNDQVGPLSADTRAALAEAGATLKAAQVALAEVPALVQDVRRVVGKVDDHVDPLLTSVQKTSETASATLERAQVTLTGVDGTLNQDSALGYEFVKTLRELRETSRALGSLADYLERNPDAPVYGIRRPTAQGGR